MTKTPQWPEGPYKARGPLVFFANNAGGFSVCDCPSPEALAKLLAAAPNLYDALENIVIGIGMGWDLEGLVDVANAALRDARGEK